MAKKKHILSIKTSFTFIWNDSILDIVLTGRCLALCFYLKSPWPAAATRLYTWASFCILSHTAATSTRVAFVSVCVGCFVSWWRRLHGVSTVKRWHHSSVKLMCGLLQSNTHTLMICRFIKALELDQTSRKVLKVFNISGEHVTRLLCLFHKMHHSYIHTFQRAKYAPKKSKNTFLRRS